jgi:hypothetical protein
MHSGFFHPRLQNPFMAKSSGFSQDNRIATLCITDETPGMVYL